MMARDGVRTVAVRLEGGLGDHILGLRILSPICRRYPEHQVVIYSDACGHPVPREVATWSPLADAVVSVRRRDPGAGAPGIAGLDQEDRRRMLEADVFIDGFGELLFAPACALLDVPLFDVLGGQPRLQLPEGAASDLASRLTLPEACVNVGLQVAGGATADPARLRELVGRLLGEALRDPRVRVLHFYPTSYDFPRLAEPDRSARRRAVEDELVWLRALGGMSTRIVSLEDLPIAAVAALIARCRYFVGVDNGVKQLAWALGVPRTFLHPRSPGIREALRWMPDLHRVLTFDCQPDQLAAHLADLRAAIDPEQGVSVGCP